MKKGTLQIEVRITPEDNIEKPYYWVICEWTGRTWYNTGVQGNGITYQKAWEEAVKHIQEVEYMISLRK